MFLIKSKNGKLYLSNGMIINPNRTGFMGDAPHFAWANAGLWERLEKKVPPIPLETDISANTLYQKVEEAIEKDNAFQQEMADLDCEIMRAEKAWNQQTGQRLLSSMAKQGIQPLLVF